MKTEFACSSSSQTFKPLLAGRRPADNKPRADGNANLSFLLLSTSILATWSVRDPILVGSPPLLEGLAECRELLGRCIELAGRLLALSLPCLEDADPVLLLVLTGL